MHKKITADLVLPQRTVWGVLTIEDGRIASIEEKGPFRPGEDIVVPGFVDIHFHGVGPYGTLTEEDINGIASFEPSCGVTAFTPALGASPRDLRLEFLRSVRELVRSPRSGNALCAGSHLEGPWLEYEHRGGMGADMLALPTDEAVNEAVSAADGTLRLVTLAPELDNALHAIALLKKAGVAVSIGHSGASPEEFEKAVDAGLSHVCHLFDAYSPREVIEGVTRYCLADACLMEDRVTVELIVDGFHVPPELIKLACRLAGTERIVAITDSMQGTGLPNARYIQEDGTYYYLDNDSVCRAVDGDHGIVGSCLTMKKAFSNLVRKWGFSLEEASRMTSLNPARVIGLDMVTGSLEPGKAADMNILAAEDLALKTCLVHGETAFEA